MWNSFQVSWTPGSFPHPLFCTHIHVYFTYLNRKKNTEEWDLQLLSHLEPAFHSCTNKWFSEVTLWSSPTFLCIQAEAWVFAVEKSWGTASKRIEDGEYPGAGWEVSQRPAPMNKRHPGTKPQNSRLTCETVHPLHPSPEGQFSSVLPPS